MSHARKEDAAKHFPWAWLMYHALDLGISTDAFWEMTPRAICILLSEMMRANQPREKHTASGSGGQTVRLNYIPRP